MKTLATTVLLLATSFCFGQDKAAVPPEGGNWVVKNDVNPMDNTKKAIAALKSESGDETLVIRCTGDKMDLFVDTGTVVDDENPAVRIKFDDGKVQRQGWGRSSDMTALFAGDRDTFKIVPQLKTAKHFYFEYKPFQQRPTTVTFNVEGLPITECK